MTRFIKSLTLVTLLFGLSAPAWSQASTEGKEFWVALGLTDNGSSTGSREYYPFIAISTKNECDVTISNPATGWSDTKHLLANTWGVARTNPIGNETQEDGYMFSIPEEQWYPQNAKQANYPNASEAAGYMLGLKVTATEDISVFAAIRQEFGYDASNILPTTALQYDYITQDYPPSQSNSYITILATEDNTHVTYTLGGNTIAHNINTTQSVTLSKGQVWFLVSRSGTESLSGTQISADKKIAVFNGNVFTRVPGAQSARDCLYEQAMPIDYWGTEFVVTRSLKKDANRIRITAQEDGTQIDIDGFESVYSVNRGETIEFELSDNMGTSGALNGEAHYIKTSCPCAVYSYDVSSQYTASGSSDVDASYPGDPSMVWIAPLEQNIKMITFGACGTKEINSNGKTVFHYVNVVCLTSDISTFKLISDQNNSFPINFKPVPGNTKYSYGRTFLVDSEQDNDKVFTMSCSNGLIAQIYGHGYNESYAYSVGSSVVSLGSIDVNSRPFSNESNFSDIPYCINSELTFDASAGSTVIDKVDWDFGDGITQSINSATATHKYTVPGWYDVTARLYAHKDCPATTYPPFDVKFTFRVVRPDTIDETVVVCASDFPYTFMGKTFTMKDSNVDEIIKDTVQGDDCSNVYILTIHALANKETTINLDEVYTDEQRQDRAFIPGDDHGNPPDYADNSGTYTRIYYRKNSTCDSVVHYMVSIIKCLDFKVDEDNPKKEYSACLNESATIPYSHDRNGQAGDAFFEFTIGDSDMQIPATITQLRDDGSSRVFGEIDLLFTNIAPGHYNGVIKVLDKNCKNSDGTPQYAVSETITVTILYPSDIFKAKFGNSLSVYNPGYGGNKVDASKPDGDPKNGWKFVAYQWYKNGQPIDSLTAKDPLYYTPYNEEGKHIKLEGEYYVELTREDGVKLKSCSQTFVNGKQSTPNPAPASQENDPDEASAPNAAQKVLQNRQFLILRDGHSYNIYGQKIK